MNVIDSVSSSVVRKLSMALGALLVGSASVTANPREHRRIEGQPSGDAGISRGHQY